MKTFKQVNLIKMACRRLLVCCASAYLLATQAYAAQPVILKGLQPTEQAGATAEEKKWTINVKDADILSFIQQVSNITRNSIIVDPAVKGKVTVISQKPLSQQEVEDLFFSVLKIHGYVATSSDGVITIATQKGKAVSAPIADKKDKGGQFVTRIIPLQYISAQQLVPMLKPMMPDYGFLEPASSGNAIIISDYGNSIKRLESIISYFDVKETAEIEVIKLKEAWVDTVMQLLVKLLDSGNGAAKPTILGKDLKSVSSSMVSLVADERSNSLIVKGSASERARVRDLVAKLDSPTGDSGSTQVFYLHHGDAENIAEILGDIVQSDDGGKPLPGEKPSGKVFIKADKSLNALVVRASPGVMNDIRQMIEKLDIRRAQVLIEAAIVEVTSELADQFGVQATVGDGTIPAGVSATSFSNAGVSVASILAALGSGSSASLGSGLTVNIATEDQFGVLLQALSSSSNANLLSTPSITALDNQEAKIVVGQNVPFITGSYATSAGGSSDNPFTVIERKDVGITLKVTPHIQHDSLIRLDVEQEVSSIVTSTVSGAADLVTNKRTIQTTILAEDKETITLGGLIQDDIVDSVNKVPLLGDIPVLGELFKSTSKSKVKRNLLVFLRPSVLRNKEQTNKMTKEKYKGIQALQIQLAKPSANTNDAPPEKKPIGSLFNGAANAPSHE